MKKILVTESQMKNVIESLINEQSDIIYNKERNHALTQPQWDDEKRREKIARGLETGEMSFNNKLSSTPGPDLSEKNLQTAIKNSNKVIVNVYNQMKNSNYPNLQIPQKDERGAYIPTEQMLNYRPGVTGVSGVEQYYNIYLRAAQKQPNQQMGTTTSIVNTKTRKPIQ